MIFVALLVGVLLKLCTKHLKIPYTPIVTVVGLIYGICDQHLFKKSIEEDVLQATIEEL